jgi:hypothetical protein
VLLNCRINREVVLIGLIMGTLAAAGVSIIKTAQLHGLGHEASDPRLVTGDDVQPLVRRCQIYFGVDHKAWAECMGVGYKE